MSQQDHNRPFQQPVIGQRVLAEHRAYNVVELEIGMPGGRTRTKPFVRHRGAVCVLPMLETPGRSPKLVLVVNERHIVGARLEEFPAGGIDQGEGPAEAAARELREETGYEATSLHKLGSFYTTPGITDELMHAFVATGLRQVGQQLEEDEALTVSVRTLAEYEGMVDRGEILDGKSLLAFMWARRAGYLR